MFIDKLSDRQNKLYLRFRYDCTTVVYEVKPFERKTKENQRNLRTISSVDSVLRRKDARYAYGCLRYLDLVTRNVFVVLLRPTILTIEIVLRSRSRPLVNSVIKRFMHFPLKERHALFLPGAHIRSLPLLPSRFPLSSRFVDLSLRFLASRSYSPSILESAKAETARYLFPVVRFASVT